MRVSDRGSGRSGAIDEAADIAIPDQPSVTVTSQLLTERAYSRFPVRTDHATPQPSHRTTRRADRTSTVHTTLSVVRQVLRVSFILAALALGPTASLRGRRRRNAQRSCSPVTSLEISTLLVLQLYTYSNVCKLATSC